MIFQGRPKKDPFLIPPKSVRFSTPNYWDAAMFLYRWFAVTREEQRDINITKADSLKRTVDRTSKFLTAEITKDEAIREVIGGEEIARMICNLSRSICYDYQT